MITAKEARDNLKNSKMLRFDYIEKLINSAIENHIDYIDIDYDLSKVEICELEKIGYKVESYKLGIGYTVSWR